MFGLGIGSLLGGVLAERVTKRILCYFFIELLLGLFGLLSLPFLRILGQATAGSNYIIALGCMFCFLCIPTLLMGTTLPLLTKIYNTYISNFLSSVSILYFINTLGAAFGSVCASYIIISFLGLDSGIYIAALINIILALAIFSAYFLQHPYKQALVQDKKSPSAFEDTLGNSAYVFVFITGFLAIGYEIIWFRVIGVLVKESAYSFSTVLGVYLIGIALGSYWIDRFLARRPTVNRKNLYFLLQVLIGAYSLVVIIGYFYATRFTPFAFLTQLSFSQITHPNFELILSPATSFSLQSRTQLIIKFFALLDVFFWPMLFVFIPTIFMGASFPLLSSLAFSPKRREGGTVGRVYFWNIFGNVLGGIVTGFVLLPVLKTETTLLVFGVIGLLFMTLIISDYESMFAAKILRHMLMVFCIVAATILFPARGELYKIMHNVWQHEARVTEGIDSVIVTQHSSDSLSPFQTALYINGSLHGFLPGHHFYAGAMEIFRYSASPKRVLVIGFGIGTLTDALLKSSLVQTVTVVELSKTLIQNLQQLPFCKKIFADPRLHLVIDDGRRYLLRTTEKFDLIVMDPLKTTWAYSNNLYSQDFFRLVKSRLAHDGMLCLFMGGEQVMAKTLLSVFTHVRDYGGGFFAASAPFTERNFDPEKYLAGFNASDREHIYNIYKTIHCIADEKMLRETTSKYPVNKDLKPVLEYYLGAQVKERFIWNK